VDTVRKTKSSIKQLIIPGMLFENMGLTYLGPVDGHNMRQMMRLFNEAKRVEGAVIVHVLTEKGRGYEPASTHPERFHGTGPFDIATGALLEKKSGPTYTDVFSEAMLRLGEKEPRLVGITAAMPEGTGLKAFAAKYPDRFFDVGIAEEHAVSFAAGLALGGIIPVVAIYSSFLQRAVDQILHDVCMQNQHVIFAIDRAGLVGADGETHQGNFDLSYLSMMPNMTVLAPKNSQELSDMMDFAVAHDGPVAIRYPRGKACQGFAAFHEEIRYGKSEVLHEGERAALLGVGSMTEICEDVWRSLHERGIDVTLVNARFVKPIDTALIDELCKTHPVLVTVEENVKNGGYGEHVSAYVEACHPSVHVVNLSIWDRFVEHGSVDSLRSKVGLSAERILEAIEEYL
jgi:1-deoxy-D-xylulose-5-phosphate synthase